MGEQKRKFSQLIRELQPDCTYCSGDRRSVEMDHCPPIGVFTHKQRPKGLEFGACKECHKGTRQLDCIAAVASRLMPAPSTLEERYDIKKYMIGMVNNYRVVADIFDGSQSRKSHSLSDIPIVGDSGKMFTLAMHAFAARLGLALYRQNMERAAPSHMLIYTTWFDSKEIFDRSLPGELNKIFQNFSTLSAGKRSVGKQFQYDSVFDCEENFFSCFAKFRESFCTLISITPETQDDWLGGERVAIFRPGFLNGFDILDLENIRNHYKH